MAVIDAGPAVEPHLQALIDVTRGASQVTVVVTHGHGDHAPGGRALAGRLGVELHGPAGVEGVTRPLRDGDVIPTDEGDLVAVDTPGHARHHIGLHWPARGAFFAADLLLGQGDTVWVGEYAGSVADYLASLERVRRLRVGVIYPAHGPPIHDPDETIDRYLAHRRGRIRQVEAALAERPGASAEELLEAVYRGTLPDGARKAALASLDALKAHVEGRRA